MNLKWGTNDRDLGKSRGESRRETDKGNDEEARDEMRSASIRPSLHRCDAGWPE